MRAALVVGILACGLLAGCIEAGIDVIEQAREDRRAREDEPQESVEGNDVYGPPTPTPVATTPPPTPVVTTPPTPPAATPTPPSEPAPPPPPPTPPQTPPPPPTPPAPATPWPREGSYVRLEVESWVSSPPAEEARATRVWANWTYVDDDWVGTCEGLAREVTYTEDDPPHWPLFNTRDVPAVGDDVRAWYLWECTITNDVARYDGHADGRHSASMPEPTFFHTEWDARSGLVLGWDLHETGGGSFGRLTATDAPLSSGIGYEAPHG